MSQQPDLQQQPQSQTPPPPRRPRRGRPALAVAMGLLALSPVERVRAFEPGGLRRPSGFTARSWEDGGETRESRLLTMPRTDILERHLRTLTEEPRLAGTTGGEVSARYVHERFLEYGWTSRMVPYDVTLSYPVRVRFEMTVPTVRKGPASEVGVPEDKDSYHPGLVGPYFAYSGSGRVEGEVVYANYGLEEDYATLEQLGVVVKDRIVLVRFGRGYRGVKVRLAEQRGAAAVLIYSDPQDDGYFRGDVYPKGPWRPETAVQRGSILYTFLCPGDPLTPGFASVEGARRIEASDAATLPRIPAIPLCAQDGQAILAGMDGKNVPGGWQGGLPLAYHVGPGPARVSLDVEVSLQRKRIWNVIATLPGAVEEDRWVLMGNHRDAWCYGAVDPTSGTATLLEVARMLGELRKGGDWMNRRTLMLCSWDAEEFGLVGSTEWAEQHREELMGHAVAYLNCDAGVSGGAFGAAATPSLHRFVRELSRAVHDPRTGETLHDAAIRRISPGSPAASPSASSNATPPGQQQPVGSLGSGSDYSPFVHHCGIPAIDAWSSGPYGVYHSTYDSFTWMTRFGDPGFTTHATMARWFGLAMLRLGDSDILPFDFELYGASLHEDLTRLATLHDQGQVSLSSLLSRAETLTREGRALNDAMRAAEVSGAAGPQIQRRLNDVLVSVERQLLDERGLEGRPWYRHLLSAPSPANGYAGAPFPDLTEALARGDAVRIHRDLGRLELALDRVLRQVRAAREILSTY